MVSHRRQIVEPCLEHIDILTASRSPLVRSANLLRRATGLFPRTDPRRLRLLPDLGEVLLEQGEFDEAERLLSETVLEAARSGDRQLQT